jgi:hypothetical protein
MVTSSLYRSSDRSKLLHQFNLVYFRHCPYGQCLYGQFLYFFYYSKLQTGIYKKQRRAKKHATRYQGTGSTLIALTIINLKELSNG